MKTLFKISPLYYLFIVIVIFTGQFNNFIVFTIIISFHELGHILMSLIYKWKIDRIVILPLGCITFFNIFLNTRIFEEFMVTIMGPIFQLLLIPILKDNTINFFLLSFNLLPINPLDGSKILNSIFNLFFSYLTSLKLTLIISLITSVIVLILSHNLIISISVLVLLFKNIEEYKNIKYLFNKFLLERTQYNFNFKHTKYVNSLKKMKKNYKHLIKNGNIYITEKSYLKKT